jgi:ABC-type Fe3+-hydroxamate transport system substrate-binding protein
VTSRTVVDDLGEHVTVPGSPQRIVSLVPNLSEVLWWWRMAASIVAVTDYCVAPPRAFASATRIRGTKNPDVRTIVDLAPDLVVANEEENRELDVRRLREAGVAVYVTRVRGVHDAARSFVGLGEVVGQPDAGVELAAALHRAAASVRIAGPRVEVICPIWRDGAQKGDDETWWTVGRDTFAADLLATVGFDVRSAGDHDARSPVRYPRARLGALAELDPDAVLLPDEPYAFQAEDIEVFAPWRGAVRTLDGTALTWWGPRTPPAIGDLHRLRRQIARPRRRPAGP